MTTRRISAFPYQVSNPAGLSVRSRPISSFRKWMPRSSVPRVDRMQADETKNRRSNTTPRGARANVHRTPGQRNQKPACLPESRNHCSLPPRTAASLTQSP